MSQLVLIIDNLSLACDIAMFQTYVGKWKSKNRQGRGKNHKCKEYL